MRLTRLFIFTCSIIVTACSVGPVRTYEGAPKSRDQVAHVVVPGAVSLDSVDGKDFSSPPDQTRTYDIELLPGRHVLAFRYAALWGPPDSETLVTSNYAAFDATFAAGQTYQLEYEVPKDEYDAIERKNTFKPVLVLSGTNQKLASRQLYGSDALRQTLAEMNAQAAVPQVQVSKPVVDVNKLEPAQPSATATQTPLPGADAAVKEDTVKRLKFWWLMSNEKEREEFLRWMKTADESFSEQNPAKQQ